MAAFWEQAESLLMRCSLLLHMDSRHCGGAESQWENGTRNGNASVLPSPAAVVPTWPLVTCVIACPIKATFSPVFFPTNSPISRNYRLSVRKLMLAFWGSRSLHSRRVQCHGLFVQLWCRLISLSDDTIRPSLSSHQVPLQSISIKVSLKCYCSLCTI